MAGHRQLRAPAVASPRAELADALVADAERGRTTEQELWALARLAGARADLRAAQLRRAARARRTRRRAPAGAASGRARTRTASPSPRSRAPRAIASATSSPRCASASRAAWTTLPDGARLARIVREAVALEAREEARLLDESLPAGLRLRA